MRNKFTYFTNCIASNAEFINQLIDKEKEITLATLKKNCDINQDVLDMLGYTQDCRLKIDKDWHVRYFKGKADGERYYFIRHSAIEYVFKK